MRIRRSVRPVALKPKSSPAARKPAVARAKQRRSVSAVPRQHVVLVPGFVGFDALGQVNYYSGVTRVFNAWRAGLAATRRCELHSFDSFPTASVELRAQRLLDFLIELDVSGELGDEDEIALIGHSTGGLDIRKLLLDLNASDTMPRTILGMDEVSTARVHKAIRRVVFISVPQYGTALADYISGLEGAIQGFLRTLAADLQHNPFWLSDKFHQLRSKLVGSRSHLLCAVFDALRESDERLAQTRADQARAREARAQLALWLDHMSKDFDAILDLTSECGHGDERCQSPAHVSAERRAAEKASWANLRTRSYATKVPAEGVAHGVVLDAARILAKLTGKPFGVAQAPINIAHDVSPFAELEAFTDRLRGLFTAVPLIGARVGMWARPALPFELGYTICAHGPARLDALKKAGALPLTISRLDGSRVEVSKLKSSDNDGVVNTLSMLWPFNEPGERRHQIFLVEADHADVIGHHDLDPPADEVPSFNSELPRHQAYDLFQSGVPFHRPQLEVLWRHIFDFAFDE